MEDNTTTQEVKTKFCKHCGGKIPKDAILCTLYGRQVEEIKSKTEKPSIVINNDNNNVNTTSNIAQNGAMGYGWPKNKWVALLLCFFLGCFGRHKFYEWKAGMGVLYIFTVGLFGIGVIVDFITILFRPNPYFVYWFDF